MKFESPKGPDNVVDIRTGKTFESPETERTMKNAAEQFDALLPLLNENGLKLWRKNGFTDEKKLRKLPEDEIVRRKQEFVDAVLKDMDGLCETRALKFWVRECRALHADTKSSPENRALGLRTYDEQFRIGQGLSEAHLETLKALFL